MKKEDLTALGLTEDQTAKVFELNGKDVNAVKEKATADVAKIQEQLTSATESLKNFEGIDPTKLQEEITTLNTKLKTQADEFAAKEAARQFDELINGEINSQKGRNVKAIGALLDIETLRSSKNQQADVKAAVEAVKKDNAYLFESEEPFDNPTAKTGGKLPEGGAKEAFAREVMGLTEKKG